MSSVSMPARPAEAERKGDNPILWGLRVAVLLAVFDIQLADQIPANYYARLQSPLSVIFNPGAASSGLAGHLLLIAGSVILAFVFPYLLAQRPFWYNPRQNARGATPTVTAVSALATIVLAWTLLVVVLAIATNFDAESSFKYSGSLLFVLLLQTLGSLYAGFVGARGAAEDARRLGAIAGLICGLAVAVAWGVADVINGFTGGMDTQYATLASVARLVIFPALGYFAGRQGGILWVAQGAGTPRQRAPRQTTAGAQAALGALRSLRLWSGGLRSLRMGSGVLWGAVGLLLLVLFLPAPFSPIDVITANTTAGRFAQFGTQSLVAWGALLGVGAAAFLLWQGLRWAWPRLAPARRIVWQGILYALAIGGAGDRLRSRGLRRLLIATGLAFLLFWPYLDEYILGAGTDARVSALGDVGRYVILALGLNVVIGFAGLLDLGYVAFFAFGAYTWAMIGSPQFPQIVALVHRLDGTGIIQRQLPFGLNWAWWFWPALLIGALVAAGFGVLLGAPTLRLRGDYLAIVTLGFGEIVPVVFLNIPKLSLSSNGLSGVSSPILPGLAFPWFAATPFYFLMLVLIGVAILCNIRLRDSRLGRAWVALREDEIATAASGVNTVRTKLLAFGTGAFFSGMAGVFHASKLGIISPDQFRFGDSISYVAMVVLGGIGSIPGVILGAVIIASLNLYVLIQLNVLRSDPSNILYVFHSVDFAQARNLIFGAMLVLMMLLRPEGLIPNIRRRAELHGEVAAETEGPVLDALDAAIGGPAYTEERVE